MVQVCCILAAGCIKDAIPVDGLGTNFVVPTIGLRNLRSDWKMRCVFEMNIESMIGGSEASGISHLQELVQNASTEHSAHP